MKRVLTSAILLLMVAFAFASNPTVTVTAFSDNASNPRANIYTISFATAIANLDSAFIMAGTSTPFDIGGGQGAHYADSLATLELTSSETTADSVRFTILWQVTSAASPEMEAGDLKTWSTAKSDAVTFTNVGSGAVATFAIKRHAGQARKLRVVILENDANKDATQTISGRLLIPKR